MTDWIGRSNGLVALDSRSRANPFQHKGGPAAWSFFLAAVLLVKLIGVSTQFVILDGILWDAVDSQVVVATPEAKSGFPREYSAIPRP